MNPSLSATSFLRTCFALAFFSLLNMPPAVRAFVDTTFPTTTTNKQIFSRRALLRRPPPPYYEQASDRLLICQAVSDLGEDSDASALPEPVTNPQSTTGTGNKMFQWWQKKRFGVPLLPPTNFKEGLLKVSNFASLLCVLDCTILPVITIVLPLFGIVAGSPAQMEWLHELGHSLALWFVLPVGGLATTLNYTNHRKLWIASMGWTGLVAVLAANAGCVHVPFGGHVLHDVLHVLHHGVIHRITNLVGCALLLSSNYLSHKQGGCRDPTCKHVH